MSLRTRARRRALFSLLGITLISAGLSAAPANATFPGSPGKLAMTDHGIWTMNPDGTELVELTENMPFAGDDPAYSFDGSKIVFQYTEATEIEDDGYGIWIMDSDGTNRRQITKAPREEAQADRDPVLSPDGTQVAYIRTNALRVMNIDGSNDHQVGVADPNFLHDPEWSPDGTQIAYSYNNGDIFIADVASGVARNFTDQSANNETSPSWSPDGTELAYSTTTGVEVTALDGTNRRALVTGLYEVWDVAWSPDGSQIAFIADIDGSGEQVWMMNADGTDRHLVHERVFGTTLDWQPLPAPMTGTNRGETMVGTPNADRMWALGGKDTMRGLDGNDELSGGNGDDKVNGDAGDDLLYGDLNGDAGTGSPGSDTLNGGAGSDHLFGEYLDDTLNGGDGGDVLEGWFGNDKLVGGPGTDRFIGGAGKDTCVFDNRLEARFARGCEVEVRDF